MTDLKPCPFCGEHAETDFIPDHGSYRIECSVLNCATGPIRDSEAEAIRDWNDRATPAPAQPEGAAIHTEDADPKELAVLMREIFPPDRGLLGDLPSFGKMQPDPLHVANERGEGEEVKDAARYRFLRDSDGLDEEIAGLNQCHWDKVIDAAMAAAPKEKP